MKTSEQGLDFICNNEGFAAVAYWDEDGYSIAFGHHGADVHAGQTCTRAEGLVWLAADVARDEAAVNACVKVPLTQNQFDALIDFSYNEGPNALATSTALRLLNVGDYAGAAAALEMWDKDMQGGVLAVDPNLLARRKAEAALFLRPMQVTAQ